MRTTLNMFLALSVFVLVGCSKTEKEKVYLEKILIPETLSIQEGQSKQLPVNIYPSGITEEYMVLWKSSDNEVASVDANGNVKAIKAGKTVITAYEQDFQSIKSECKVTVSAIPVEIEEVAFVNPPSILLENSLVELSVRTSPVDINQPYELIFESSDPTVATISDGQLKALKAGGTSISVSVKDKPEIKAQFKLIVTIQLDIPDKAFFQYCLDNFDLNKDGILTQKELEDSRVTSLDISNKGIHSLEGIRYFTNLTILQCNNK